MAEVLGVASSAIQVADAGFKLYGALSNYVRDYIDADKHAKRLTDEVRTTAWALQQLSEFLKEDDEARLCKPEVLKETESALKGCQTAFDEVSQILDGFSQKSCSGNVKKRWKWPLKKDKALLLLAQFERLKTTLLLVFKVLSYASKLASTKAQNSTSLAEEKTQVIYLVKAQHEAAMNQNNLIARAAALSIDESPSYLEPGNFNTSRHILTASTLGPDAAREYTSRKSAQTAVTNNKTSEDHVFRDTEGVEHSIPRPNVSLDQVSVDLFTKALLFPGPTTSVTSGQDTTRTKYPGVQELEKGPDYLPRKQVLLTHLDHCIEAVIRLSSALHDAKINLQEQGSMPISQVSRALRLAKRAIDDLSTAEHDADSEDETDRLPTTSNDLASEISESHDHSMASVRDKSDTSPQILELNLQQRQGNMGQRTMEQFMLPEAELDGSLAQFVSPYLPSIDRASPQTPHGTAQQLHQIDQPNEHALQDHQMALMLLEQQNKKRLLMARQAAPSDMDFTTIMASQRGWLPRIPASVAAETEEADPSQPKDVAAPTSDFDLSLSDPLAVDQQQDSDVNIGAQATSQDDHNSSDCDSFSREIIIDVVDSEETSTTKKGPFTAVAGKTSITRKGPSTAVTTANKRAAPCEQPCNNEDDSLTGGGRGRTKRSVKRARGGGSVSEGQDFDQRPIVITTMSSAFNNDIDVHDGESLVLGKSAMGSEDVVAKLLRKWTTVAV